MTKPSGLHVEICAADVAFDRIRNQVDRCGVATSVTRANSGGDAPGDPAAVVRVVDCPSADLAARLTAARGTAGDAAVVALLPADAGDDAIVAAHVAGADECVRGHGDDPDRLAAAVRSAFARAAARRERARNNELAERDFLAAVIHDLRSPMTGIIGMTSLLLETDLDARQAEYLDVVRSCSDTLLRLVNDFLDFAKIEAGRLELNPIEFDVRTAVEETLRMFASQAKAKNVDLTLVARPGVPERVVGDPGRVRQILANLVSNAVKFTPSGEVTVEVDTTPSDAGTILRFRVNDSGVGIPEDRIGALFQPYAQADRTVSRRHGGTGLGLFICARLAEMMGGRIGVTSSVGEGSTFWFTVRVESKTERAELGPAMLASGAAPRVLVLDRQPSSREAIVADLVAAGLEADGHDEVAPAIEALLEAAAVGNPYHAVLLSGPAASSVDTARTVRRHSELGSVRLVQLVDFGHRGDAARARAAGMDAYLTRPLPFAEILECLMHVLADPDEERDGDLVTRHTLVESRRVKVPRILVADDDPREQRRVARLLDDLGYRSDCVEDGEAAMAALNGTSYAAALIDCGMPGLSAFEISERLRGAAAVQVQPPPVIGLLTEWKPAQRERCLRAGMTDAMAKPLASDVLEDQLKRILKASEAMFSGGSSFSVAA